LLTFPIPSFSKIFPNFNFWYIPIHHHLATLFQSCLESRAATEKEKLLKELSSLEAKLQEVTSALGGSSNRTVATRVNKKT
jgi:hypothetical protein